MAGFSAIGLHNPKFPENIGGALRAGLAYGASMVAISGRRANGAAIRHPANTSKSHVNIPVLRGDLRELVPFGAMPIAVDLIDGAIPLPEFKHPLNAFYIFGPEDGTLGRAILEWCPATVFVPTAFCMNLAACVNVVLYDRLAKLGAGR